jgi:hypothetical protein
LHVCDRRAGRVSRLYLLPLLVDSSNRILQNAAANPLVLMTSLYLDLANLNRIRLIKQLNHPNAQTVNFDGVDCTALPAFSAMLEVSSFSQPPNVAINSSWYTSRRKRSAIPRLQWMLELAGSS